MTLSGLLAQWNRLPPPARVVAVVVFAGIVAVALGIAVVGQPHRTALFSSALRPEQLSEVEQRLAEWNAPFSATAENVLVDARRRNDLLLRLSLAGVPHAHVDGSSDVLAKLGALTPQSVIEAQTREGLAGDVELALRDVAGIDEARVLIAPAKPGYFADDASRDATASVRLRLHPGVRLGSATVAGVRAFVAGSVPGLDERNVTILDDRGVRLGSVDDATDATSLQDALQSALDGALGSGAAIVRVRVERDARHRTLHATRRAPLGALATTQNDERYSGDGKRYERTASQSERGVETQDVTETQEGGVDRIAAAVFLSDANAARVPQVRALAAATLGLHPSRGDTLSVEALAPSDGARRAARDPWILAYAAVVAVLPQCVFALVAIAVLAFARKPALECAAAFGRRISVRRLEGSRESFAPATVHRALADEPPHAAAAILSALPASTAAAVLQMYPASERDAIVARMQRSFSSAVPDAREFLERA